MDINIAIGIVGLILAYLGVAYARKTFKKDHIEKPNENKLHLQASFMATRKLSQDLYNELHEFATRKNYFDEQMWPGVTYRIYMQELLNSQNSNLSEEVLKNTLSLELPEMSIQSMSKSLDDQFNALMLVRNELKMKSHSL